VVVEVVVVVVTKELGIISIENSNSQHSLAGNSISRNFIRSSHKGSPF
jgi:hypothetical protein